MADVKDILGVPRAAQPGDRQDVQKEKKEKMKRPEGLSREAFALLGDIHPIMASHLVGGLKMQKKENKPKAATKGVVTFQYKAFKNPARSDDLQLTHWVKGYKDASGRVRDAEEGEYVYAKFNKKVRLELSNGYGHAAVGGLGEHRIPPRC